MADTAAQFDRLFTAALPKTGVGDTKPKKEQERDYEQLHKFVLGLKEPKPLDSCTDTYLRIYEKYSPTDPRSKQVFVILLERRIKYAPSGDAIFDELHKRLREKQYPPSPIYVRFHSLDDHNQAEIYKLLDEARRAGALLDELRQAYLKAYGFAAKSFDDLYNFDPQRDDALQKQLQALMDECKRAWGKAQDFSPENWEKFRASFQTFGDFIKQHGGNTLTLFQLLKWTWDPFHVHYKSGARGRERYQQPFGDVDVELYLRIVIALLIRGANVKAGNLRGFTDEEHRFFFEPLAEQYYFPDYKNRFRIATSGRGNIQAFYDLALAHLQLLRYAKAKNVTLENADTSSAILALYETAGGLAEASRAEEKGKRRSFLTQTNIQVAKQRYFMGDTMGVGDGELRILYFEGEERGAPQIYIEFLSIPSVIFSIDIGNFSSRVEALTRLIVARDNKGLAELIERFMGVLIDFLVPEFGFVATFMERGVGGVLVEVAKQKAFDLALDAISETISQLGPGKTMGILGAMTIIAKKGKVGRLSLIKQSAARLEKFERAFLSREKREFLELAERRGGNLTTRELGDLGINPQKGERLTHEEMIDRLSDADRRGFGRGTGSRLNNEQAKVAPFVKQVQAPARAEEEAVRELTAEANKQLVRDGRIPPGWSVEFPRTASNEAGIAQTLAVGQRGVAEDREIIFNLDKRAAGRLDVKKQVKFDGFQRFPGPRLMLREHKEVMAVWQRSGFSSPRALDDLVDMMEHHGRFLEELDGAPNSWWLGVTYTGGGNARIQELLDIALIRARQRLPQKIGKRLLSGG